MSSIKTILKSLSSEFTPILKDTTHEDYVRIDLSVNNPELENVSISEIDDCTNYVENILHKNNAKVAFGGYLEKRNLYANNSKFTSKDANNRNIHLGIDFWTKAGSKVLTPLDGVVHSFKNNYNHGDYGPTIILEHKIKDSLFYTLYGHLSLESISDVCVGQKFNKGSILATLGTPDINVGYAPHLHFQLIKNMQGCIGDYAGVSSAIDKEFYMENCPNPNLLLNL